MTKIRQTRRIIFNASGIHYIGEMRNNTVSRLLIEQLTDGQLVWENLVDDFDVVRTLSISYLIYFLRIKEF